VKACIVSKTIDAREEGDEELGIEFELTINSFQFQLSGVAGREKITDLELADADVQPPSYIFITNPSKTFNCLLNHNTTTRPQLRIGTFELGVAAAWKSRRWPGDRRNNGHRNNDNGGEAEEAKGRQSATRERAIHQMLLGHSQLSNSRIPGHRILEAKERSEPQ
jgi:hypothetical protein